MFLALCMKTGVEPEETLFLCVHGMEMELEENCFCCADGSGASRTNMCVCADGSRAGRESEQGGAGRHPVRLWAMAV